MAASQEQFAPIHADVHVCIATWSGTHPRPPMGRWTPGAISLVGIGRGAVVATAVATRAASEATMPYVHDTIGHDIVS
jgi:hypothetical protein